MNEENRRSLSDSELEASERLAREKRLFAYHCALENGDFETVTAILAEAEQDATLERMILEINTAHIEEIQQTTQAQEDTALIGLLQKHFPSAYMDAGADAEDEIELPPLTIADVLAQVRPGEDLTQAAERNELNALRSRAAGSEPIPQDLSGRGVRQFLASLGITISRRVENAFRNTAILLAQGRQQNMAQLAATRRQRSASQHSTSRPPVSERSDSDKDSVSEQ